MTDWPEAAVEVTAGVAPGGDPEGVAKIWNEGPPVGAGAHWNAHPMFQVPPAMVNAGLVQFPVCWVEGTRTVGGPTAAGVAAPDDPPATVVDVEPPAAVVVVDPPAAVVVVADPAAAADATVVGVPDWGGNL